MISLSTNRLFLTQEDISKKDEIRRFVDLHCEKELSTLTITEDINKEVNISLIMKVEYKDSTEYQNTIGYIFLYKEEPITNKTFRLEFAFNNKSLINNLEKEAIKAFLYYVFENLDAHRIISKCSPTDSNRWKILEKLSFREEGIFVKSVATASNYNKEISWNDELIYALLKEEYEEFTCSSEINSYGIVSLYNKMQKNKVIYDKILS